MVQAEAREQDGRPDKKVYRLTERGREAFRGALTGPPPEPETIKSDLLFMLMFAIFLLGFFFDFLEITLIILPVFAPIIRTMAPAFAPHLGMEPPTNMAQTQALQDQVIYWFAILAATNLQTSFLTPPFGFALFYMKGVAPSAVKMQDIYKGIIPFVILQVIGLSAVVMFPELALWLPDKVFSR